LHIERLAFSVWHSAGQQWAAALESRKLIGRPSPQFEVFAGIELGRAVVDGSNPHQSTKSHTAGRLLVLTPLDVVLRYGGRRREIP
jgi:hypothetical protein